MIRLASIIKAKNLSESASIMSQMPRNTYQISTMVC